MKKYMLVLVFASLFITLIGFNANSANASNCAPGDLFDSTTGQSCVVPKTSNECAPGDVFSSITGLPCNGSIGINLPVGCTSTSGFSPVTGESCSSSGGGGGGGVPIPINPIVNLSYTQSSPTQIGNPTLYNFSLSSVKTFDKVVINSDCKNNEVKISSLSLGLLSCKTFTVPLLPTTGIAHSLYLSSKDSNTHYVTVKASIYAKGNFVGTASTLVPVYPLTKKIPFITVLSPNGGETWVKGTTQNISWLSNQSSKNVNVELRHYPLQSNPSDAIVIANNVVNNGSYSWNVGKFILNDQRGVDGKYLMEVCTIGSGGLCDQSDSTFLMTSNSAQPSVTSLGTDNAMPGEKVAAFISNFPQPSPYVKYSISFYRTNSSVAATYVEATLSSDGTYLGFTVPNITAGLYNVGAVFADGNSSFETKHSLSFTIGSQSSQSSITVLSPNGGETWVKGTTQTIKWQDTNNISTHEVKLVPYYPPCTTNVCPAYPYQAPYTIANTQGSSYDWPVGKNFETYPNLAPDGSYTIQVCQTGSSNCDSSDSYFKITSGTTSSLPDLTISDVVCNPFSPKGLELIYCDVTVYNKSSVNVNTQFNVNINGSLAYIDSLAAYSKKTVSTQYPSSLSLPGPNNVSFLVDWDNKVPESNDYDNNEYKKIITIQPTFSGEGTFKLGHWSTLQLNNGLILYADGANVLGVTPYKVSFKVYDVKNNYNLITTIDDLPIGFSQTISLAQRKITLKVNAIDVQSPGNAMWTADITATSSGITSPSITVLSPNGGDTWALSDFQKVIRWNYPSELNSFNSTVTVSLVTPDRSHTYSIFQGNLGVVTTEKYQGEVPWSGLSNAPSGRYFVNVNIADSITNKVYVGISGLFSVASPTTTTYPPGCTSTSGFSPTTGESCGGPASNNHAPVIQPPFLTQSSVAVGQLANFNFNAKDADNDNLSWGVDWGESGGASSCPVNPPIGTGQGWNYSTSHTWNTAGNYTVKVYVNDCRGGSDSELFTVNVGNTTLPPGCTSTSGFSPTTGQSCGGPVTPPSTLQYGPNDQVVTFSKSFYVSQTGSPVTLSIAADNRFSVSVNGIPVSTNNSETNFYSSQNVDITSAVNQGKNILAITIDNTADSNNATPWSTNPGGTIYKLTYNGATLAVSDGYEQSSVSSTMVIPQNKILYTWTSIPGANWIWDSSYFNGGSSTQQPAITSISPQSGVAGIKGVGDPSVTIYGSGFTQSSSVLIGNVNFGSSWSVVLAPTYISSDGTKIIFTFPGSALLTPDDYSIKVTNANAGLTSNPVTFTLTSTTTQPSITVLSPNGGEVWQQGTNHNITWQAQNFPANGQVRIDVRGWSYPLPTQTIITAVNAGSQFYQWTVPSSLPQGDYRIEIYQLDTNSNITDASAKAISQDSFTITATQTPSTYPNLAGTWYYGSKATSIVQSGSTLTFTNENGSVSPGYFSSTKSVVANYWGNGNLTGAISSDIQKISWANNTTWTRTSPTTQPSIVVTINGKTTPQTINGLPTDQGYSNPSNGAWGAPGYYLTLSWTSPGATSCGLTSGTGDIEGTYPSPNTVTFNNLNSIQLEDGDVINFNCGGATNSVNYTLKSSTSMNTSANYTANVINAITNTSKTENAVSSGKFNFTQFLSEGSYGNEVKELQKFLNGAGYDVGNADGIFGAKVKESLIKFQTANGLKSDGIVGYEVRSFLNK